MEKPDSDIVDSGNIVDVEFSNTDNKHLYSYIEGTENKDPTNKTEFKNGRYKCYNINVGYFFLTSLDTDKPQLKYKVIQPWYEYTKINGKQIKEIIGFDGNGANGKIKLYPPPSAGGKKCKSRRRNRRHRKSKTNKRRKTHKNT